MEGVSEFFQDVLATLGESLPNILIALGVLIGGWLLALLGRALTRAALTRTGIDRRLAKLFGATEKTSAIRLTSWVSRIVYYLILLFVLVAILNVLQLGAAAAPISSVLDEILGFLPRILSAAAILLVAWIVASAVRFVITRGLRAVRLDNWLTQEAKVETPGQTSVSAMLGNVAYWLVFLLFLPAVLGALEVAGLLEPVQGVVNEILGVLPSLLGAAVILVLGWIAARIVRQIATNLLAGAGLDRMGERTGVSQALGDQKLSSVVGVIVYVLILIPVVIAALDALEIEAISGPASEILTTILTAIPAIFAAMLLIGVAYFVAKWVGGFVTNVLAGVGFDNVLGWIGLSGEMGKDGQSPSQVVGYLATLAIMLFAVIEAANLLGFAFIADLITQFLAAAGGLVAGVVIFGLGLYFARIAERVIRGTGGSQAHLLAPVARVTIIVFTGALALRQTGIAEDIVNLAFGIVLGTVAVAAALAFGLGARDIAAKEVEGWLKAARGSKR
ncbi:MAG: mechanosensitive ion channel [Chloroflexota bacterium]